MDDEGIAEGGLELGDSSFAAFVRRWREALANLPGEWPDEGYAALVDAISQWQADRIGVDVADWMTCDPAHVERARELLGEVDEAGLNDLWDEAHTLGWFHQHFGEIERDASNRAHTRDEAKHASQMVTTQLYTPRWIAEFLVGECLEAADSKAPTVCDPALGGGQMLLAALDWLCERGVALETAVERLHGVDLDGRAVEAARRALKLHVARLDGERRPELEQKIDANLRVGDGLFGELGTFDVVVTNPPYMGSRSMPGPLKERIRGEFRPFHADLYTAFIRRCHALSSDMVGVLAQQTVWFLSRFKKARSWLLDNAELVAFMHLGAHAFANLSGEKASVVAFVQKCCEPSGEEAVFIDLRDESDAESKRSAFIDSLERRRPWRRKDEHDARDGVAPVTREPVAAFDALPGRVLAHWLPENLRRHFETSPKLIDLADIPGSQNKTANNRKYVKKWSEVDTAELRRAPEISGEVGSADGRWVFYSKGGRFAPWWGNWQNVVDWSDAARVFYADNKTSNLLAEKWWFREGICYTDFGGRTFNARWMPPGCLFDMAGPAIFAREGGRRRLFALLAVLNSTPVRALLNAMNPSLHYQVRDLRNLPVPELDADTEAELARRAGELVAGMQAVAGLWEGSPRSLLADEVDRAEVRVFLERRPQLEHELDRMVCELYGCPELLVSVEERPVHDYVGRVGG
ncbi:MAG: Eco57I restriction-modification methylase domain-containing protein [Persicimonas sp.]